MNNTNNPSYVHKQSVLYGLSTISHHELGMIELRITGKLLDKYFQNYEQITKKPGLVVFIVWIIRGTFSKRYRDLNLLKRYFISSRCKNNSNLLESNLPEIEILMVSKKEDFSVLKVSLEYSIKMSVNPVSSITVIVPKNEVNLVKTFLNVMAEFQKINVIPENKVVSKEVIELITKNRPDRFGWILQQVLVASYIINSRSEYILVVDADTVLLRPRIWVDKNSKQILMPTQELHKPYYDFLRSSSNLYGKTAISFMSHHLLIQVKIFKEIFEMFNGSVLTALQKAFAFSSPTESAPFDLKYEIYSQYLLLKHKGQLDLVKWGNLSLPRSDLNQFISSKDIKFSLTQRYNSVSFHSWNV